MITTTQHPVAPEELMAYLDGELSPDRAAETASHLESCKECQTLAADLGGVSQKLIQWQIEVPEPNLTESLVEELSKRKEGKQAKFVAQHRSQMSFLKPKLLWAGGVAAVFVLILAIATPNLMYRKAADEAPRAIRERQQASAGQGKIPGVTVADGNLSANLSPPRSTTAYLAQNSLGKLEKEQIEAEESKVPANNGPMIVRTAELSLTTNKFEQSRAAVEEILKRHKGYVGELHVDTATGSARSLRGELRLPSSQLDAALTDFKALGRVEGETQGGEEVTQKYVDLEARLANSKHTEQRLSDMLLNRTGKLSDVLAVEMQISRVRGEIEQMEAERKQLKNQVDYATLTITVNEDYKAELKVVPPSTSTQIRNAAVNGYRNLVDGLLGVFLWLLSVLPALLVWCGLLFFPARFAWKKLRPRFAREIGPVSGM